MATTEYLAHKITNTFTVWARLDNHEPGREHFRGTIRVLEPTKPDVPRVWILVANDTFIAGIMKPGPNPVFLLDDGETVKPLYVVGDSTRGDIWLREFPVNPDKETREDGKVIDYSFWSLGPRTAYHLKIHE